jgi:DNA repair photolyase
MDLDTSTSGSFSPSERVLQHPATDSYGAVEREMRQVVSKLKGTRYPDSFDWSVYDKIAECLPDSPRGGVVFNTTFKLVNHHSSCSKCHYAFEIDSYGRGCFHNCAYCYAKDQLSTHGYWNRPQPFPVNLAEVRKVFYTVFETDRSNRWREVMERRVPLRIGSMSDSFMWLDTKYGVTKELLRILRFYKYPYIVFTRSDLVAHADYIELLDKELCSVQFSITGNNNAFVRKVEPGAPSYEKRLRALEKLNQAGFWTTVRINPLFPRFPDGYFTDREAVNQRFGAEKIPTMPWYTDEFVGELADTGVPSILAGFVRLSSMAITNISGATGVDLRPFFRPDLLQGRGDKRFSDKEISYYYRWLASECRKHQVRFSTCYIGNGIKDYFQYQDLWSNKADCCDALGSVRSFTTTSQSISWSERKRHAPCATSADANEAMDLQASTNSEGSTSTVRSDLQ